MDLLARARAHRYLCYLVAVWLLWLLLLSGFQELVRARFNLAPPDTAVFWSAKETVPHSQDGKPYLNEPFLNDHVSWDSEYYLSIAVAGYDDTQVGHIPAAPGRGGGLAVVGGPPPGVVPPPGGPPPGVNRSSSGSPAGSPPGYNTGEGLAKNYAFLPFYPFAIRIVAAPLAVLGLSPIATSTLAGVLVAALGALAAMLALYDLTSEELGEAGGLRTAFYLLIFPTGFFLAQVYTEGLFVGLAFGSLALLRRKMWLGAALLAAGAVLTRAVGVALVLPLAWSFLEEIGSRFRNRSGLHWSTLLHGLLILLPVLVFLIWQNSSLGQSFAIVEREFFHRGFLMTTASLKAWQDAWARASSGNMQGQAYYLLEFGAIAFGVLASLVEARHRPGLAAFSLAVIVISAASGVAQGMLRYVLTAPAVFTVLARWGRNEAFDRSWTFSSILLMGMTATLFTFDFWAG